MRFSVHKYEGYFVDFVFVLVFFALPFFLNFMVPVCRNCFTCLVMVFCMKLFLIRRPCSPYDMFQMCCVVKSPLSLKSYFVYLVFG